MEMNRYYLFNGSGSIVDSVGAILLPNNISYGRNLNDANNWSIFQNPTPGYPNSSLGYIGQPADPVINLPSGFYDSNVTLSLSVQEDEVKTYYTLDGSEPNTKLQIYLLIKSILNKTYVLKLKSFKDGLLPSKTITNTYFIK